MNRYGRCFALMVAGLLVALAASGCTTVHHEFDGYDRAHVWSVMTAVAQSPEYNDWHLISNNVWHAPDEARMEVYRKLHRAIREPGRKPRIEEREWRLRIEMLDTEPPSARLVSRGWGVPAHARIEGERYFADVWQMLGDRPARRPETSPSPPVNDSPQSPESDESADAPPVDLDDVDEGD